MALFITATPIGHPEDITLRARRLLMEAAIVIGEERAETERFLKKLGHYPFPRIELLNEHSTQADVAELALLCQSQDVMLISDCGTPGFCDPGVELSAACRAQGTRVVPIPGASSLMALLSVVGARFGEFHFAGFPPRDEHLRATWMQNWTQAACAVVAMDTPYRLQKFVAELAAAVPRRRALIGMDLTLESERIEEGTLSELTTRFPVGTKGEFILCLYPYQSAVARPSGPHTFMKTTPPATPAPARGGSVGNAPRPQKTAEKRSTPTRGHATFSTRLKTQAGPFLIKLFLF